MRRSGPQVLVVEDDADIRELVTGWLERAGFCVRAEPDSERGLAAVWEQRPDVVVLDWMTPGMDGLEVCRRLRHDSATAHLPVLALSARATPPEIDRMLAAGADAYLVKPITRAQLIDGVRGLVPSIGDGDGIARPDAA